MAERRLAKFFELMRSGENGSGWSPGAKQGRCGGRWLTGGITQGAAGRVVRTYGTQRGLWMRPVRTRDCAAAVLIATSRVPKHGSVGMRCRRVMAMVRSFAQAAVVRRRSFCLDRDRDHGPE